MKIRTITTGVSLGTPKEENKIRDVAIFNQKAKNFFEQNGYEVQTTRITTNSWQEYLKDLSEEQILREIQKIEALCNSLKINFFNIGYADNPSKINIITQIIKDTSIISCSAKIGDRISGINFKNVKASARVIKQIAENSENGYGNFRFCAACNCDPHIPFFPASYHEGKISFSIGLENSDLVMQAFSDSNNLQEAEQNLKSIFEEKLKNIETLALQISKEQDLCYKGIDASVAPSLSENESLVFAYEKLGFGKFGQPGTLSISSIITKVLKNLSVKKCGYSGLMLPVAEDFGLAQRANEQSYGLTNLLLYSAVCGCGFDVVPLPGDISVEKIEALLLDVASLAIKLNKPLSARLLPIPGRKAGEKTSFNSPYLVDCNILKID